MSDAIDPGVQPVTGYDAIVLDDGGARIDPVTPSEWDAWVSAGRTRNYCEDDPVLDWLDRYGSAKGFDRDDELDGYDPRTDFLRFILEQGRRFEEAVLDLIEGMVPVTRIGQGWRDARDLAKAEATLDAMLAGTPVISQGIVRDPSARMYGAIDLLVRSDVLERLVPGTLEPDEVAMPAPVLGDVTWHYRVVDIKYTTLHLLKDSHAASEHLAYMAQVWVYNRALGRLQGYRPPSAYLLGRRWCASSERGTSCLERLARVDDGHVPRSTGAPLGDTVADAADWVRRLRREGGSWEVLPEPSVPELYPHARNLQDQPWHVAKAAIAQELEELTLLPGMNPRRRRQAHAAGMSWWRDPGVNATSLAVDARYASQCDAVLAANRDVEGDPVKPASIVMDSQEWRTVLPLELYVDFETVNDVADDFTRLPEAGGQTLIFQIGCGWYEDDEWRFWQATADRLDPASEAILIDAWVAHIGALVGDHGLTDADLRVYHWSHAEPSSLDNAYNAARTRHPDRDWPDIAWFDALVRIVRPAPMAVRGAFAFGLKPIARAMARAGLIETTWDDGPTDGLGAMVGAWWCDAEAARSGSSMVAQPLMQDIGRYNEIDCRAMAEVIRWLREHR